MQHYRLPTRLLDWTESILVATYFAVVDRPGVDGTVWMLSPHSLNKVALGVSGLPAASHPAVVELVGAVFSPNAEDKDQVVGFRPREADNRMLLQQSAFTVHGSARGIKKGRKTADCLGRINIPAENKRYLLHELKHMGIKRSTLFPDLESLAADIREEHKKAATPETAT